MARRLAVTLLLAVLAPAAAALAATPSQRFFKDLLVKDKRTSSTIRALLEDGGGFVDSRVIFADLTGDERSDAVVQVASGGAAGNVAFYVFSTHGRSRDSKLRAVYRRQSVYRVTVRVRGTRVIARAPHYDADDELCCPSGFTESTLRWNREDRRFRVTDTTELDADGKPVPEEGTDAPPAR